MFGAIASWVGERALASCLGGAASTAAPIKASLDQMQQGFTGKNIEAISAINRQRGVRTLPRLPKTERTPEVHAPDTLMLYDYLKTFNGVCASHTSATDMGTDWRDNHPLGIEQMNCVTFAVTVIVVTLVSHSVHTIRSVRQQT